MIIPLDYACLNASLQKMPFLRAPREKQAATHRTIDENFHPGKEEDVVIMSLQVISGQLLFESLGNEINLNDGQFLTLHQELSFKATAKTDILCLLTMIM